MCGYIQFWVPGELTGGRGFLRGEPRILMSSDESEDDSESRGALFCSLWALRHARYKFMSVKGGVEELDGIVIASMNNVFEIVFIFISGWVRREKP